MTAREAIAAAAAARLRTATGLAGVGVFDAPPVRAALPYVQVEEPVLGDWSTATWSGREGRLTLLTCDAAQGGGERPVRLRALAEAAEAALLALPADLGGGWRLANLWLLRSRIARGTDRWTATSEFQVRLYRPAA